MQELKPGAPSVLHIENLTEIIIAVENNVLLVEVISLPSQCDGTPKKNLESSSLDKLAATAIF